MIALSLLNCNLQAQDPGGASQSGGTTMLGTYYSDRFVGRKTSNGEVFRQNQYTAAHKTIPFGTYLLVINPANNRQVVVRVNDRCPKAGILDMTKLAVHELGIRGSAKVHVIRLDADSSYEQWIGQDTTSMAREEYYAYGDRCKSRKISPYDIGNGTKPSASTSKPKKGHHHAKPKKETPADSAGDGSSTDTISTHIDSTARPLADTTVFVPYKGPKYDIELCVVGSRAGAMREIARLPQELQNKVVLDTNESNGQILLILAIAESRKNAVRTQAMLEDTFPESCIVSHTDE